LNHFEEGDAAGQMRIAQVSFTNFRGIKTGKITLPPHSVLLGGNNVGKTAVVDAIALVFGRERITAQLSDWDFFGGMPKPNSRFTIVCTVTDFSSNNPKDSPAWFSGSSAAQPAWWNESQEILTFETDCPVGAKLAAQIALCARYEEDDCEFETKRYFCNGDGDPFTDGCETVSLRRVEELGVFVIPGNRQWDRLMSFASSTFLKALRQSDAMPGKEIEKLKLELRESQSGVEAAVGFKSVVASTENELRSLAMLERTSNLVYRMTSLDTAGILQTLIPHIKDLAGTFLPINKHGAGMVSLQSFLVVLAIAHKRKEASKNFILIAEEPELHLHPSLHKRLVNRIRAVSTQSLVTTHSPLVASSYIPSDSLFMRNSAGIATVERLRTEPIKSIEHNAIRRLYLEKREAFYEAILGAAVLVPEGEHDFEWFRLLQRLAESSTELSSELPAFSVVPTQDAALVDTYREVIRFNPTVLPIVDGDEEGSNYLNQLLGLEKVPAKIVRFGVDAATEALAAWVLEPCLPNPGPVLHGLLGNAKKFGLRDLQRALWDATNKKDRDLRESIVAEAMDRPECIKRATEFLKDLAAILGNRPQENSGWTQSADPSGARIYIATHICKA
jgi:putative ATP-dependent endonuclease of OLD family